MSTETGLPIGGVLRTGLRMAPATKIINVGAVQENTVSLIVRGGGITGQPAGWLQHDIAVKQYAPELYGVLAETAKSLHGAVDDFSFLHQPPGLSLRMRPRPGRERDAAAEVRRAIDQLSTLDIVAGWRPTGYEPEYRRFGGPIGMDNAHRLFAADSRAWLQFHHATALSPGGMTTWAMSLLMIRAVLDGLGITRCQEQGVWDRLGLSMPEDTLTDSTIDRMVVAVWNGWAAPETLARHLPPAARLILDAFRHEAAAVGRQWTREYFLAPGASVGPQQAAAQAVALHWNRGRLPFIHQALITHALRLTEGCAVPTASRTGCSTPAHRR
jgi:thiopeptide-type bacteriocin biosynthesis protein